MSAVSALAGVLVGAAFALGAIPFGVLLARARGIDLKKVGSGNIGATNAARALGRRAGLLVLLLDGWKAWLPTFLALRLGLGPEVAAAAGLSAFLGHIYSPLLRFRGGKGVACGLGTFLALCPAAAGLAALAFATTIALTRTGSLGSLVGGLALLPALHWQQAPRIYLALAGAMYLLVLWRHRGNLRRLFSGREHKV